MKKNPLAIGDDDWLEGGLIPSKSLGIRGGGGVAARPEEMMVGGGGGGGSTRSGGGGEMGD